jgi:hypothetical protein
VFARENGGFDAIVGNPPFLGAKRISSENGDSYRDWLPLAHGATSSNVDLVGHFFLRAFTALRRGGTLGMIASNTISQGDTREGALRVILESGGNILRTIKRLKWPGEAAVVVSVLHVCNGEIGKAVLDNRSVSRISAYLVEGRLDDSPEHLAANEGKAFQASIVLGMGFTFDDAAAEQGIGESTGVMNQLLQQKPENAARIFPFLGGDEVTNDPRHLHHRYIIDFEDFPLKLVSQQWPDLLCIVERRVRPERKKQKRKDLADRWWQFAYRKKGLYRAIANIPFVLVVNCGASPQFGIARVRARQVFAHSLVVFTSGEFQVFAALQGRPHEMWTRSFASTLEDRLRYTPSDCLETFPFPNRFQQSPELEAASRAYHDHRAALMIARNEGMTKTYNRFHDRTETAEDIQSLRELHAAMDRAVLEAYASGASTEAEARGWHDLAERAEPLFLDETNEDDHTYQGRLFWPAAFRDEVLARLLALNAERHAEEVRLGIAPGMKKKSRGDDDDEPEDD